MRIIEKLNDYIEDEIEGADDYARCALRYKKTDPALAQMFVALAADELKHMNLLHDAVVKKITAYRQTNGEPPADMQAVYDYLHNKQIDDVNDIKALLAEYKTP